MFADHEVWWEWYEGTPQVSVRNDPWPNASNVIIPLIKMHSDGLIASYYNSLFSRRNFYFGSTFNDEFRRFVTHIVSLLNWGARGGEYDMQAPVLDWVSEFVPVGDSTLGLAWASRERWLWVPGSKTPQRVQLKKGPVVEHIPRAQMLWQEGRTLQESEMVVRQSLYSWSDYVGYAQLADWNPKVVETAQGGGGGGSIGLEAERAKRKREGFASDAVNQLHDIREVWVDWPILSGLQIDEIGYQDPKSPSVPLVITMDMDQAEILKVIAKPYFIPGWPFYEGHFRRRSHRGTSPGVAKVLEHMQRAASTMVNQSIDVVTLANSISGTTTDPKLLNQRWAPNHWMNVANHDDIREFQMSKLVFPDIALINMMKGFAETLMGQSDPFFGKETRLGGHPSPATNFLGAIQQGGKMAAAGLKQIRQQLSLLGLDIATLYQQFEANEDGKITRALGQGDAQELMEWLFPTNQSIHGNLELDINAISESSSPENERQRALFVDQATNNFYAFAIQGLTALSDPRIAQNAPAVEAIVMGIQARAKAYTKILEASEIDEIEEFVLKLRDSNNDPRAIGQLADAVSGRAGAIQDVAARGAVGPGLPGPNGGEATVPRAVGSGL
jgi:hypothetical protein